MTTTKIITAIREHQETYALALMGESVTLSAADVQRIGEYAMHWLRSCDVRLEETDDGGIVCTPRTHYFVVPAPGYESERERVVGAYRTLAEAKRAATKGYVARKGALTKGDLWLRVYAATYPVAQ